MARYGVDEPDPPQAGLGAVFWAVLGVVALLAFLAGTCVRAHGSPLFLSMESGATSFKYNETTGSEGIPLFSNPRWDFSMAFEWSPAERTGLWLSVGFRYQALGESKYSPQTFVDGPRIGIKYRGRLTQ